MASAIGPSTEPYRPLLPDDLGRFPRSPVEKKHRHFRPKALFQNPRKQAISCDISNLQEAREQNFTGTSDI
jgi:hypothetical protein